MLFAGLVTEDSEYFSREEGLRLYPRYQFIFEVLLILNLTIIPHLAP